MCPITSPPPGDAGAGSGAIRAPRIARRLWSSARPNTTEAVVLALVALAVGYQLFFEPVVGMANNADFLRLIAPAGLGYKSNADYWDSVFRYIEVKFVHVPPAPFRYMTSQRLVVHAAKVLDALLSKDGLFDIRAMGACNLALYILALAIFLRAFRHRGVVTRSMVVLFVLVVGCDVKLVAYFNSFYSESSSLIFLMATVGVALICTTVRQGRLAWALWCGYVVSATLFWTAKSQNIAFVPVLALCAWLLFPAPRNHWARVAAACFIPACAAYAFHSNVYAGTVGVNAAVVLNEEILPHSKRPESDKEELGVGRGGPTLSTIAWFYVKHSARWWRMAKRNTKEAFSYIPYGNFDRASGLGPNAQSQAFNFWSELKKARYPKSLSFLIAVSLLYVLGAAAKAKWMDRDYVDRALTLAGPILLLGCAAEFVVTVTFEANGTAKHLFIFNVAIDIVILFGILALLGGARAAMQRLFPWIAVPGRPCEDRCS